MRGAAEAQTLQLEFLADERDQVAAGDDDIAAENAGRFLDLRESGTEFLENFLGEEGDLSLVVILEIVEAIAAEAVAGDAFDLLDFLEGEVVRFATVVTIVVVARGDEDFFDLHG